MSTEAVVRGLDVDDREVARSYFPEYPIAGHNIVLSRRYPDVNNAMVNVLSTLQKRTQLPIHVLKSLLQVHQWESDKVLDAVAKSGGSLPSDDTPVSELLTANKLQSERKDDSYTCSICLETRGLRFGAASHCGHYACYECWREYIESHAQGGESFMRCAAFKCGKYLDDGFVFCLSSVPTVAKYRRWGQEAFIGYQKGYQFCPNPRCDAISKVYDKQSAVVACYCGHVYCPVCSKVAHWPVSCDDVDAYGKLRFANSIDQAQKLVSTHA